MSTSAKLVLSFVVIVIVGVLLIARASTSSRHAFDDAVVVLQQVLPEVTSDVGEDLNEIFLREVEPNTSFHEWVQRYEQDGNYEKLMEKMGERTGFYVHDGGGFRSYSRHRQMEYEVILSSPSPSGDFLQVLEGGYRRVHLLVRLSRRQHPFDRSPILEIVDNGAPQNGLFIDRLSAVLKARELDFLFSVSRSNTVYNKPMKLTGQSTDNR